MRAVIGSLAFSLGLSVAFAETVTVGPIGWRQTGGVAVPQGETKTISAPLVVGDRATFVKTGEGTLEVPVGALDRTAANPTYAVLGGTLKITDTAVTPDANPAPACCQNAAAWFSAADTSFITGEANDVQRWYDVRETNQSTPTRCYMTHALSTEYSESSVSKQSLTTVDGRNAVYFGGLAAKNGGGYMHLQTPGGEDTEFKIVRTVFFVHAIREGVGTVFGSMTDPNEFFCGGAPRPIGSTGYVYYRADSLVGTSTGRSYRNGDAFDIFHEKIAARAEVIAVDFTEKAGKFGTFFNQRGRTAQKDRYGGDYLSEFIAFTNRLTEAEIVSVNRYLMRKWNLGLDSRKPVRLEIAKGATVELAPTVNMYYTNYFPVVFAGEGAIRHNGSQWLSFPGEAFKEFGGKLELPSDRSVISRFDELPPVAPVGGRTYTTYLESRAALNIDGRLRLQTMTAGASDVVTKKGEGELALVTEALPAGVKKLQIDAGTLTLRGESTNDLYASATDGTGFNAVFPNPTAELVQYVAGNPYTIESDCRLKLRNGTKNPATIDGWTQPDTSYGTSGYVVLPGGAPNGTWPNGIPEGNQALFVMSSLSNKVSEIYTTVAFPVAGEYLVSWRETRNYGGDARGSLAYSLKLGKEADGWAAAPIIAKRTVATGQFPRVFVKVTVAEAGSYLFGFQVDSFHYSETAVSYMAMVVDDFRGDLLTQKKSAARVFRIPNGDFEETYREDGVHGGKDISVLGEGTVATNWTFSQGANWPKAGDANRCVAVGVSGYAFPRHNPQNYNSGANGPQPLFGRNADVKEGNHMLFLCRGTTVGIGSYAETTFTVPKAGTYLLRGKASRWNVSYLDTDFLGQQNGMPYVSAKVTIGGAETDLGVLPCDRHIQEDRVWTNAFTVAADNTSVTLRLAQTELKFGAIVDDLVLVDIAAPSFDDGVEEIIRNGSFELDATLNSDGNVSGADTYWTLIRSVKSDGSLGSSPSFYCNLGSTGQQYVKAAYDGEVVCSIRGTCEIRQDVTLTPGRYRFRFAANSRSNGGYDKNGLVIALYDMATNEVTRIFTTEAVTNYNPHVFETKFDLAVGGAYLFSVKGDPHDVEHAAGQERDNRCTVIDGLSLRKIANVDTRAVPQLAEDLSVEVASGAKLKLDFAGAVKVGKVKLGGTRVFREISAATCPDYVEGPGSLTVEPKGFTILVR